MMMMMKNSMGINIPTDRNGKIPLKVKCPIEITQMWKDYPEQVCKNIAALAEMYDFEWIYISRLGYSIKRFPEDLLRYVFVPLMTAHKPGDPIENVGCFMGVNYSRDKTSATLYIEGWTEAYAKEQHEMLVNKLIGAG